jgi:hypothetical protein
MLELTPIISQIPMGLTSKINNRRFEDVHMAYRDSVLATSVIVAQALL